MRILFLTFDSFTDLGGTKAERIQWSVRGFSWERERKGRRENNVNGLREKESHVYD